MSLAHAVAPTGVERTFDPDEIIVSKTDLTGHITYVNHVFTRVSGYPAEDLLGQPHSIIRHPAMPGGVFKLLWERIQSGAEIYAYVLNLAGDGAHYWVLAHVTPTRDASGRVVGYHSNRRSPAPSAIAEISGLYDRLRAAEAGGSGRPAAAQRGADELAAALAAVKATYDEFIWDVIARHDVGRHSGPGPWSAGTGEREGARS